MRFLFLCAVSFAVCIGELKSMGENPLNIDHRQTTKTDISSTVSESDTREDNYPPEMKESFAYDSREEWKNKEHGRYIKSLYKEALKSNNFFFLEEEVEKGSPLAKSFLSRLFEIEANRSRMNTLRAKRLKHESVEMLERFAQEGRCSGVVYSVLAKLYEEGVRPGDRLQYDKKQVTFYYQKAVDLEDDEAAVWLGTRYKLGDNIIVGDQDIEVAFSLYEKAADQENLEAVEFLKEIARTEKNSAYTFKVALRFQEGRGVLADDSIAMHFYEKTIGLDHSLPEALFRLANLQRKYGKYKEAAELYGRLIIFGELYVEDSQSFLDALCVQGESYAFYYRAHVNKKNGKREESLADFQQAIERGLEDLYDQASAYEELNQLDKASDLYNTLVEKDSDKALTSLERLSSPILSHACSQFYLAKRLLEGAYIPKDIEKAHKLLRSASYAYQGARDMLSEFFRENEVNLNLLSNLTGCSNWESFDALESLIIKDRSTTFEEVVLISQHLKKLKTLSLQLMEGSEQAVDDLIRNMPHLEKLDLLGVIVPDAIILNWFQEGQLSNLSVFGCQVHAEINGVRAFERLIPRIFSAPQHLLFVRLNTTGVGLGTEIGSQWIVRKGVNWIKNNLDDFEYSAHLYRFWVPDHDYHSCNSPTVWASRSEKNIRYFREKSSMGFIELTESVVREKDWWKVPDPMESYMSCFGFMQLYQEGSVIVAPGTYFRGKPWPKPGLVVWKHEI